MPHPHNYNLSLPDPTQTFMQSFALGQQLQQREKERALQERRSQVYAGLGPNSTYQDYMAAIQQLPEDRESLLATMKAMDGAKKSALFDAGGKAWARLQPDASGKIDPANALGRLEEYAAAFENGGDADTAKQLRDAAKAIEIDPLSGRNILGTMLAMTDPDKFKSVAEVGENRFVKDVQDLSALFGRETALRMVGGREAAKGVVSATGPAGTQFIRAEDVFQLPLGEQPAAAASVAAAPDGDPRDMQNSMTVDQFLAAAEAIGKDGAYRLIQRNNIPVRVRTPAEARRLPSGTSIIMPDGSLGKVP